MSLVISDNAMKAAFDYLTGDTKSNAFTKMGDGVGMKFDAIEIKIISASEIKVGFFWQRTEMFEMQAPRFTDVGDTVCIVGLEGAMKAEINK